ncbi:hypothetical protein PVAND_013643 [Polypedilum vanderplanki]|uniref:PLD phosphodiesterase domain-containing protein n=1 Tax=Polypedilum vanderplanki TaxID=319348 RepID=A0A9J6CR46_POLVA|nr:hypothetical protein PVAND_013643 [Polypedilum vanderplanki]
MKIFAVNTEVEKDLKKLTVLESNNRDLNQVPVGDDDFELWDYSQMLRNQQRYKWNNNGMVCKPSCIPIFFILILIVLVVLLPLLDSHNDNKVLGRNGTIIGWNCVDECSIQLVESIPEGLVYDPDSPSFMSTYDAWTQLINDTQKQLLIGSFYWTLKSDEVYNHSSSIYGDKIFHSLLNAGTERKIDIRIAQNMPSQVSPNIDTEIFQKRKAAKVRSVNFPRLLGGGVLHTKLWISDNKHFYIGSANMDWRSLSQVKELGVLVNNCSCLTKDLTKIFNIYWELGRNDSVIPSKWSDKFNTGINMDKPMLVNYNNNYLFSTFFSNSPPPLNAKGRTNDLDAIVHTILSAEKYVKISVMDYFPLQLYSPKITYWGEIDNALRTAAINNRVSVKLLISYWNHSRPSEDYFLKSLTDLSGSYKGVDIQVKRFIVPATEEQKKIPFGRVNHNKYMVTDQVAYIGTSNWSGDYFTNTAGVGFVAQDTVNDRSDNVTTLRSQLDSIFERDWNSKYAVNQDKLES